MPAGAPDQQEVSAMPGGLLYVLVCLLVLLLILAVLGVI